MEIFGHDITREEMTVKRLINRVSVDAAFFKKLSPMENLLFAARLYGIDSGFARSDTVRITERLGIARKRLGRPVEQLSRGMQQKIAIARALLTSPALLLLDEPTTGLDPRSRLAMWDTIRSLAAGGTTLLLTTQYLDEADELADEIVVIDHGVVIAAGTAEELKSRVGGDVLEFTEPDRSRIGDACATVAKIGDAEPHMDGETGVISVGVGGRGSEALIEAVRGLDAAGVETRGLMLRRPSLDDVFMALTGHAAEETTQPAKRRGRRRPADKDTDQDTVRAAS